MKCTCKENIVHGWVDLCPVCAEEQETSARESALVDITLKLRTSLRMVGTMPLSTAQKLQATRELRAWAADEQARVTAWYGLPARGKVAA